MPIIEPLQEGATMTTVMVVEDDPAFLTRFCRIVASAPDLTLMAAVSDLASARAAVARQVPDVLLTDLGLPDGSGIGLIRSSCKDCSCPESIGEILLAPLTHTANAI
jgi:response regulator of citrate/malate metabolism